MALTRGALLISNPGEIGEENYANGVYVDIKNYQQHLTSAVGGAWETSEIQHLDRPARATVRWWLNAFSLYDYVPLPSHRFSGFEVTLEKRSWLAVC